MSFQAPVDVAQATLLREVPKVVALLKTLSELGVTCPDLIEASIESETNLIEKLDVLLMSEGEIDAKIEGQKLYIEKMQKRMASFQAARDQVREVIVETFERIGLSKVQTTTATVFLAADVPKATIVNEALIGAEYYVSVLDKTGAKKAAIDREKARREIIKQFGDSVLDDDADAIALIGALWDFDDANPEIEGIEVSEPSKSMRVKRV